MAIRVVKKELLIPMKKETCADRSENFGKEMEEEKERKN